jgi:hypothetical protein
LKEHGIIVLNGDEVDYFDKLNKWIEKSNIKKD